jgi:hypothetical protein
MGGCEPLLSTQPDSGDNSLWPQGIQYSDVSRPEMSLLLDYESTQGAHGSVVRGAGLQGFRSTFVVHSESALPSFPGFRIRLAYSRLRP